MRLAIEKYSPEDMRNALKQTGLPLRKISKDLYPNSGEDYLSHKLRAGNLSLTDLIKIKEYVNNKFGKGYLNKCLKRHHDLVYYKKNKYDLTI